MRAVMFAFVGGVALAGVSAQAAPLPPPTSWSLRLVKNLGCAPFVLQALPRAEGELCRLGHGIGSRRGRCLTQPRPSGPCSRLDRGTLLAATQLA